MLAVQVRKNEPIDMVLRQFRHACERAGVFNELRKREYYEKSASVRKRKAEAIVKREKMRISSQRATAHDLVDVLNGAVISFGCLLKSLVRRMVLQSDLKFYL